MADEVVLIALAVLALVGLGVIAIWGLILKIVIHQNQKEMRSDLELLARRLHDAVGDGQLQEVRSDLRLLASQLEGLAKDLRRRLEQEEVPAGREPPTAAAAAPASPPIPEAAPPVPTAAVPITPPPRPPPIPPAVAPHEILREETEPGPVEPVVASILAEPTEPGPVEPVVASILAEPTEPGEIGPVPAAEGAGARGSMRRFEAAALAVLRKAWNWLIVGEEFRDPNRSLEYSVATTWGVRLAVALIVTGIAFGLRLSFEKGLIGPLGRVTLGVLAGVGLTGGGLLLLGRRYHVLGQGLIGGGLATLYVTSFAAHHLYGLVGVWGAFGWMAVVTAAAGVISVSVSSLLIAVLGIIGGYLTPFVLRGSGAGYEAFFGYLVLLAVGILIVGHFRYWVLLNYLGMGFAYVHVLRTLHANYQPEHFGRVMPFLVALFVLYSAVTIIYNLARRRRSTLVEVLGLMVNSGVFFWIGQDLIRRSYEREQVAILTVGLAALYVALIYVFLARRQVDRPLLLSLLALAGFYAAMTMPLVLSRQWLTVSWAVQAFVMLWLSRRLGSRFLQSLACVLYAIVVWRIFVLDLHGAFPRLTGELPLAVYLRDLADRLVAFGVPIAALVGAWRLHATAPVTAAAAAVPRESDTGVVVKDSVGVATFLTVAIVAGFVYLHLEVNRLFGVVCLPLRLPALTLLWLALALGLLLAKGGRTTVSLLTAAGWVALFIVLGKLLAVDLHSWGFRVEQMCFGSGYSWLEAAMRLLDFGAVVAFAGWAGYRLRRDGRAGGAGMAVVALVVLFLYLTAEVNTVVRYYVPGLRSGGISVLWSAYALALVVVGIRRALRPARLAGLVLFAVVGLKVFFIDLGHLAPIYRMLALIVMGLITLIGTFIYLRNAERFLHAAREEKAP